jgi:hypothetical protein
MVESITLSTSLDPEGVTLTPEQFHGGVNGLTRTMAGLTRQSRDVSGLYPVPADGAFAADGWYDGGDIAGIGLDLREKYPDRFGFHDQLAIDYRWKRKGGKALGMCVLVGGTTKAFVPGMDILIWLAADNCRKHRLSAYQIEALVFHEMSHVARKPSGKPCLVKHDWEGFAAEVCEYGLWLPDVQRMGEAFAQLRLEA